MSRVALVAKLTTQPGKRDDAVEGLKALVDAARAEEGTDLYALHVDLADAEVIWFYELYRDNEALEVHSQSDAMKEVFGAVGAMLDGTPEMHLVAPLAAKGFDV